MEIRYADTLERAAIFVRNSTAYEDNFLPSEIKKARKTHWWNKKLEKLRTETREDSDGPRKATRKNYGTYSMQKGIHIIIFILLYYI